MCGFRAFMWRKKNGILHGLECCELASSWVRQSQQALNSLDKTGWTTTTTTFSLPSLKKSIFLQKRS